MDYKNYLVQGGTLFYSTLKNYQIQMEAAEKQERKLVAKAVELGATVFEDEITFPGTPEEQEAKFKELLDSMGGE